MIDDSLFNKKKIVITILVVILASVILSIIYSIWSDSRTSVKNLNITNLSDTSFTVTWTSDTKYKGSIYYKSESEEWLPVFTQLNKSKFYDDRDVEINEEGEYEIVDNQLKRYTHHVTVRDLNPESEYEFRIGGKLNGKKAVINTVKTLPLIEDIKTPDPGYGRLEGNNGIDSIATFRMEGSAVLASTPIAENNTYSIDLNIFGKENIKASGISVNVYSEKFEAIGVTFDTDGYKPFEKIILQIDASEEDSSQGFVKAIQAQSATQQPPGTLIKRGETEPEIPLYSKGDYDLCLQTQRSRTTNCLCTAVDSIPREVNFCQLVNQFAQSCSKACRYGADFVGVSTTPNGGSSSTPPPSAVSPGTAADDEDDPQTSPVPAQPSATTSTGTGVLNPVSVPAGNQGSFDYCIQTQPNRTSRCLCTNTDSIPIDVNFCQLVNQFSQSCPVACSHKAENSAAADPSTDPALVPSLQPAVTAIDPFLPEPDFVEQLEEENSEMPDDAPDEDIVVDVAILSSEDGPGESVEENSEDTTDETIRPQDGVVNVWAFGDSNTVDSLPGYLYADSETIITFESSWFNKLRGSYTDTQFLNMATEDRNAAQQNIISLQSPPDIAIIFVGTPDFVINTDIGSYGNSIRNLIRRLSDKNVYSIAITLPNFIYPYNCIGDDCPYANADEATTALSSYNSAIQSACNSYSEWCSVVSSSAAVGAKLQTDGIHLTDDAHDSLVAAVRNTLTLRVNQVKSELNISNSDLLKKEGFIKGISAEQPASSTLTASESGRYIFSEGSTQLAEKDIIVENEEVTIRLFLDTNENGVRDPGENYVSDVSSISLKKEATAKAFNLNAGWNLIHIPLIDDRKTNAVRTAGDLVKYWNNQGSNILHVADFKSGQFRMFSQREGGQTFSSNFSLYPGQGLFVFNAGGNNNVTFSGRGFDESIRVELDAGWNLKGISSPNKYSSEQLLEEFNSQGFGANIISQFDNGQYQSVVIEDSLVFGNNFNINDTRGYFIRLESSREGEFVP